MSYYEPPDGPLESGFYCPACHESGPDEERPQHSECEPPPHDTHRLDVTCVWRSRMGECGHDADHPSHTPCYATPRCNDYVCHPYTPPKEA